MNLNFFCGIPHDNIKLDVFRCLVPLMCVCIAWLHVTKPHNYRPIADSIDTLFYSKMTGVFV